MANGSGGLHSTSDELDAVWHDIIATAQRACPTVHVPDDIFIAYLRERLPADIAPPLALRRMYTADLYLACACALGHPQALAVFEDRCLSHLDRVLGNMGIGSDLIADVKQDIRKRVLVGDGGRAEIVDFCGRGDLRGWVRVMAARKALQRHCRARREVSADDDALLQHMVAPDNPEVDYAKGIYREEFKRAFEDALRALPDRDQILLCQHYLDGSTLDELASLHRVHRATIARLLARARTLVLEATRAQLMSQLEVSSRELDSILCMIWSRIGISLRSLRHGRKR